MESRKPNTMSTRDSSAPNQAAARDCMHPISHFKPSALKANKFAKFCSMCGVAFAKNNDAAASCARPQEEYMAAAFSENCNKCGVERSIFDIDACSVCGAEFF